METIECAVVGAGVVGLAVARALAMQGREVVILEAADAIGTGISSRNSEVIHAGLYYAPGSMKARLCAPGRRRLYAYCESRGVAHRAVGKLVVAAKGQEQRLHDIRRRAEANGVDDLQWIDATALAAMEPALCGAAALLSPSTGIVDSHGLMLALLGEAEAAGAVLALNSPVRGAEVGDDGRLVLDVGGADPMRLAAGAMVNAAGLDAPALAGCVRGLDPARVPRGYMAKGSYFTLQGKAPFSRLIYPVPEPGGLGVHLTLDLGGQARFGPDVQWVDGRDYRVDPARGDAFYAAIRSYWPGLPDGALQPAYSGIRPKLHGPGGAETDFVIEGPAEHGVQGLVNLYGIESPGLTSCLALADHAVARLLP